MDRTRKVGIYKVLLFVTALVAIRLILSVRKYDNMVVELVGFDNPGIFMESPSSSSQSRRLQLLQFPNATGCCLNTPHVVPPLGGCPNNNDNTNNNNDNSNTTTATTMNPKEPRVEYLRSEREMKELYRNTKCTNAIEVLAWILETLQNNNNNNNKNNQDNNHHLVLAYGGLIHVFREKEFVVNNGRQYYYIDDDFDLFITPSTFQHLVTELEPILWTKFGWTIRIIKNCNDHVIFGQIFGACGHEYSTTKVSKSMQSQPGLELYPMIASTTTATTTTPTDTNKSTTQHDDNDNTDDVILYNSWHGGSFPRSAIFPATIYPFQSRGISIPYLQIPRQAHVLLECWYGNWRIPSKRHASFGNRVTDMCIKNARSFNTLSSLQ